MAILVEGISVITKVQEIHKRVPGGWEGFKKLIPNNTLCSDNEIARVGFMSPDDVESFIEELEAHSLVFQSNGEAIDIAVADQLQGLTTKCSWLEFGHINLNSDPKRRVAACRLVGSTENQIFTPDDWDFNNSLTSSYGFSPTNADKKGLKFLRHDDGVEVYLSELTGEEVYIGRTTNNANNSRSKKRKISVENCSSNIARWIEILCSPDAIEEIAKESGFKNKPLFGAKKKRMKLMAEVCCINTAIAIHAANCSFEEDDLKPVIDGFLQILQKYIFGILEKHMPEFKSLYEERMVDYFKIFNEKNPSIALSFAFLQNLHGKPKFDLKEQTILAVRFSKTMAFGVKNMRQMAGHGS